MTLLPDNTRPGDAICILYGARVRSFLRFVVGECTFQLESPA